MGLVLYSMPYSPWSERARFALLHHRLAFEEREHVPLVGELALRVRAGRLWGRVSAPLLIDDGTPIMDSFAIAEHVDRRGQGSRLFPPDRVDAIRALNLRIEPLFEAARARGLRNSLSDAEVALDLTPPALRGLPLAVAMTRVGTRFVAWKHPTPSEGIDERMRAGLQAIRSALGGRAYVHDAFSYADIVCATALQFIAPVSDRYVALSAVKRRTWADAALAAEFSDVVEWRDALYAKHRPLGP